MKVEKSETEAKTFRNMIGAQHLLTEEYGALSLVRKFDAAHAYLVLERVRDNKRYTIDVHLVVKRGTEDLPKQQADIVYREIDFDDLYKLSLGCHSVTWLVDTDQMENLERLVKEERKRAERDEIGYCVVGHAKGAGLFGASLDTVKSEVIKEWSVQQSHGSVSDFLLQREHNCYSWAQALAMNVGVKPPTVWSECFVKDPRRAITGATRGEDLEEPTTSGKGCAVV